MKKRDGEDTLTLERVRTPDGLAEVAAHPRRPQRVVGFAAETEDLEANARAKLRAKGVDLVAGNLVGIAGGGFETERNALMGVGHGGVHALGPDTKTALAGQLIDLVARAWGWKDARNTPCRGRCSKRKNGV